MKTEQGVQTEQSVQSQGGDDGPFVQPVDDKQKSKSGVTQTAQEVQRDAPQVESEAPQAQNERYPKRVTKPPTYLADYKTDFSDDDDQVRMSVDFCYHF